MGKVAEYYEEMRQLNNWDDADRHYEIDCLSSIYEEEKFKEHYKKGDKNNDNRIL